MSIYEKIKKLANINSNIENNIVENIGPVLTKEAVVSEGLSYHIKENIPLTKSIYREYTPEHFKLLIEAKELFEKGILKVSKDSEWLLVGNYGEFGEYRGRIVPLDAPMSLEDEEVTLKYAAEYKGKKVTLNKPRRIQKGEPSHGNKKFVVYVKDKDKVKRVVFGDPNLSSKPNNPKARKSFRARHKCDQKTDKTTPGYWACRYPPNW